MIPKQFTTWEHTKTSDFKKIGFYHKRKNQSR